MKNFFFILIFFINQICAMEQNQEQLKNDLIYKGFEDFLGKIETYKVTLLAGGFSGCSPYVCEVNNKKYVVRTFRDAPEVRDTKVSINCFVAQQKIAHQIHYYAHHDDFSYIIMDFIKTPTLSLEEASRPEVLDCVAQKTRTIAGFDINMETAHKEDVWGETIRHYENIKKREVKVFEPLLEEIKHKLDTIQQLLAHYNRPRVINHNDFYYRNMFFIDNDLLVIDWETLAASHEFSDLVDYSVCSCLSPTQDLYLLMKYLQRNPLESDKCYFDIVKLLMRILIVVTTLDYAKYVPQDLSFDSIKSFKEYTTAFAKDTSNDSPQFLYEFGMSQLRELRQEYEKFEKRKDIPFGMLDKDFQK